MVIQDLILEICAAPARHRMILPPVRQHFRHPFPYAVLYIDRPDCVLIIAVSAFKRDPEHWRGTSRVNNLRLPSRSETAMLCAVLLTLPNTSSLAAKPRRRAPVVARVSQKKRVVVFWRRHREAHRVLRAQPRQTATSCAARDCETASARPFFLNQDPLGFQGGLNWFAAFNNNPIGNVDPSGLDAVFVFSDGTTTRVKTAADFKKTAQSAANNSVVKLYFPHSHGSSITMGISRHTRGGRAEERIEIDSKGNVFLRSAPFYGGGGFSEPLGPLLQTKLSRDATISLDGCSTAARTNNIARSMSLLFGGAQVTGNTEPSREGWFSELTHGGSPVTYLNGNLVPLDPNAMSKSSNTLTQTIFGKGLEKGSETTINNSEVIGAGRK